MDDEMYDITEVYEILCQHGWEIQEMMKKGVLYVKTTEQGTYVPATFDNVVYLPAAKGIH